MSQSDHLTEAELRRRLAEAEAALAALRSGKADTLIGDAGPLLFQLKSAVEAQKQAEEALRRERALLERITSASPAGIVVVDRHGQITFANPQAEKILGLTKEAITQRTYNDPAWHITDLDGEPFPDEELPFRRVMATRKPVTDIRHAIELPDGRRMLLSINGAPLLDASGELEGAVFTVSDITEQLQAEEALRESEARFRRLFENSLVGIYRTTPDGRILLANPTLVKMLRYPSFEALAQLNLEKDGFHPQYPRRLFKETMERDGVVRSLESVWICADGTAIYVRESAQAVRGPDGRIEYYDGVVEDITEQRRLEESLRQAQKMEAIGRLAGGVAHDFNNILAVIMMQSELLLTQGDVAESVRDGIQQIRAAAQRAANLTRQLLAFSRRQVMQPRDLDLNDVVTNLTKMLQRIIGEDVRLELRLHPTPLMTHADAGMLDQVLMNLAVNARDAMPKGGRLIIETTAREFSAAEAAALLDVKPGHYVGLRVSDTGCGIPPEILPRIFDAVFYYQRAGQGDGPRSGHGFWDRETTRRVHPGGERTGPGHNLRGLSAPLAETTTAASEAESRPGPRGGTETILLVEDDADVRLVTRITLERHGYRVLEAPDGLAALELWRQHRDAVALLLTDLVMPGELDGRELAQRLRADRPQLKVIYTSGYSPELAGRELHSRSGEAFLQKPCPAERLLETVRECLDAPLGATRA
jgi:two-component system cell cycle sensor histidine kinase/response regulator CckA